MMKKCKFWLIPAQEGEEANTTVDSEGAVESEEVEVKAPRELTAEEIQAKVGGQTVNFFQLMKN